jgi:hypothetical protein
MEAKAVVVEVVPRLSVRIDQGVAITTVLDSRSLLEPYNQDYIQAVFELAKTREVALLVKYSNEVKMLHPSVLSTWLGYFQKPGFRVKAAVVVVDSRALRAAAAGFGRAMEVLKMKFQIQAFSTEDEGRQWLRSIGVLDPVAK